MSVFTEVALPWLWPIEGGQVDNPNDPGKKTNLGIRQDKWDAWRVANPGAPADVYALVAGDPYAEQFYADSYWDQIKGDALPAAFALVAFDTAVNSGPPVAITLLQAAVGVDVDGDLGPLTVGAAMRAGQPELDAYLWLRLDYDRAAVRHNPALLEFLPGWLRRVYLLRLRALPLLT